MRDVQEGTVGMSDLREAIKERVMNAYAAGHNDGRLVRGSRIQRESDTETDRIIEAIAQALLSDEAIDGMLQRSYGWYDYDKGLTYDDAPEEVKVEFREEGRHEMLGALAAIGYSAEGDSDE